MGKDSEGASLGWKKVIIFVLLPSVIAGLLAFVPTLYQEWKQPKASLIYEAAVGPQVSTSEGVLRIGTISVLNAGTKTLTGVRAKIESKGGAVQEFNLEDDSLVSARTRSDGGVLILDIGLVVARRTAKS